jgi:hypothetical protein
MTNPTNSSSRTYICLGCHRRYKKLKDRYLKKRYHDKNCVYFAKDGKFINYFSYHNRDWKVDPEYEKGVPKFHRELLFNNLQVEYFSAKEIAIMKIEGIAR